MIALVGLVRVGLVRCPVELLAGRVVLAHQPIALRGDGHKVVTGSLQLAVVLHLDVRRPLGDVLAIAGVLRLDRGDAALVELDVGVHLLYVVGLVDEPLVLVERCTSPALASLTQPQPSPQRAIAAQRKMPIIVFRMFVSPTSRCWVLRRLPSSEGEPPALPARPGQPHACCRAR